MPNEERVFDRGSGNRLTLHDLARYPSDSLFDTLARVVCQAGCLPRKELYEAWEVAKRVRRLLRGGRVLDLAGGHGLLAQALLLLDDSSPEAVVVDTDVPASAPKLQAALVGRWPRLGGRITFASLPLTEVAVRGDDLVVSCHACGPLTDQVLARAVSGRARVAVLPCCHDARTCDAGALGGWLDGPLAIDVMRATRLAAHGYQVWTQQIPADVTPKNRLLLAAPLDFEGAAG